jgi:hypothetical protein
MMRRLICQVIFVLSEFVTDAVMLLSKQRVQQFQAEPPVVRETAEGESGFRIKRQKKFRIEVKLPSRNQIARLWIGAQMKRFRNRFAINLRSIPPLGIFVSVGRVAGVERRATAIRRPFVSFGPVGGVRFGLRKDHPSNAVLVLQFNLFSLVRRIGVVWGEFLVLVAKPVMHLKLDPSRGQKVQSRRRLEICALEQFLTDFIWVGPFQIQLLVDGHLRLHIAA